MQLFAMAGVVVEPEALAVLRDLWAEPVGDGAEIRG